MDSNTTKIFKDIFIFSKEYIEKKITPGHKKVLTVQKGVRMLK